MINFSLKKSVDKLGLVHTKCWERAGHHGRHGDGPSGSSAQHWKMKTDPKAKVYAMVFVSPAKVQWSALSCFK